jgi:release factor glutamine methyltransferase
VVANLPYVRSSDWQTLAPEIHEYEPRLALDGGPDGLSLIKRLLLQAAPFVAGGAELYAEIGDDQGAAAIAFAQATMPSAKVEVRQDLTGRDRVLVVKP